MFKPDNEFDHSRSYQRVTEEHYKESRPARPSFRGAQRKSRKSASTKPGPGIAGRRNRRWNW